MLPGVEDSMVPTKPDPLHGQLVHLVFVVESPSGTQPFFSWQSWCWSRSAIRLITETTMGWATMDEKDPGKKGPIHRTLQSIMN